MRNMQYGNSQTNKRSGFYSNPMYMFTTPVV